MADEGGDLDAAWDLLTVIERAAVAYDWACWWAREDQVLPDDDAWRSVGFCTARRFGKTRACAEWITSEVQAGRAMRIALCAQNEDKTREVMIEGDSGLIECSPPWFKGRFERGRVVWPNGAQAFIFTPEVPGDIRGHGVHLAWCSEFIAWAPSKRDEAWSNMRIMASLGYGRVVWDSTPKRRHPIIRSLLARAEASPRLHRVVRGLITANAANLSADAIAELQAEYGGTQVGREELEGIFLDDQDGALWQQLWIDRARRDMPTHLARRVISVDPAISNRKGTDRTGLIELGLDVAGQCYVLDDFTDRYAWEAWGARVIDRYLRGACDCVIVERNRGGDAVVANLRACASQRGLRVEVVEKDALTRHSPSMIVVKELTSRQGKETRAEPVATAYEQGRVSHVNGANLAELEEVCCTWVPEHGGASPDAMDALCQGVSELLGLARAQRPDRAAAIHGAAAMQREVSAPSREAPRIDIARLLGGGGNGGRI